MLGCAVPATNCDLVAGLRIASEISRYQAEADVNCDGVVNLLDGEEKGDAAQKGNNELRPEWH